MHYVHVYKLPLPIVQKQVGHKTLKATSVYLRPSDEAVGSAYDEARARTEPNLQAKGFYSPKSSFSHDSKT